MILEEALLEASIEIDGCDARHFRRSDGFELELDGGILRISRGSHVRLQDLSRAVHVIPAPEACRGPAVLSVAALGEPVLEEEAPGMRTKKRGGR